MAGSNIKKIVKVIKEKLGAIKFVTRFYRK